MDKNYPSDFEQGYHYARNRYKELADGFGTQALLELASALLAATGSDAEAARGIAAGIQDMAQTGQQSRGNSGEPAEREKPR